MLGDLDKLHIKYMSSGLSSQTITASNGAQEIIAELRARLTSNTTILTPLLQDGGNKNLIIANGLRRKHSALPLRSTASFAPSVKTKEATQQLYKHLYRAGVAADNSRSRGSSLALFQYLNVPLVLNQKASQTASSVVHGEALVEEQQKGKDRNPNLSTLFGSVLDDEGTTLGIAAFYRHIDVVRLLLENGESIEATRSDNGAITPDTAAYHEHTDVVRLLLEKGANIEAASSNGSTALYIASWRGHICV
ncbi:hypothetical protein EV426DRAFT_714045 [Tirmania nivea]|nr:hypothetical protein EV426DRAFT_714045 [Tirmania nivea]